MTRLYLLAFFLLSPIFACSQNVLALENPRKFKRIIYRPGDWIRFQMDDGKAVYSGMIESVGDSLMVIISSNVMENEGDATNLAQKDYVVLSRIKTIYKRPDGPRGAHLVRIISGGFIVFGAAMLAIIPFNSAYTGVDIDPSGMYIAGGMLAGGVLMALTTKNKYKLKKKWRVRAMAPIIQY